MSLFGNTPERRSAIDLPHSAVNSSVRLRTLQGQSWAWSGATGHPISGRTAGSGVLGSVSRLRAVHNSWNS